AGGPYYPVKKGRWDGKTSSAWRVESNLPPANSTVDQLLSLFVSKGLSLHDLVALSGAHSIGFAHCKHFLSRLYSYDRRGGPDPAIDLRLLKALKLSCPPLGGNSDVVAPLDVNTPFLLDNVYYANLEARMGVLGTDQALFADVRTRPVAQAMAANRSLFFERFAASMDRMGSIGVKRGRKHGERRKDCSLH
ncbi:hypothetical protein M569_16692, partial [Genlisea aurea]